MDTDHRFVDFIIPENGIDYACILTIPAPDALCLIKANAAPFARPERIGWTDLHTWRIFAGAANHYNKASLHAASRFHSDTGLGKARFVLSQRAGKHTTLASNASFGVQGY